MKHPTYNELLEFVDGTLEPSRFHEVEHLIFRSKHLQDEITLIKNIGTVVRNQTTNPSRKFTSNIMGEINHGYAESFWYRVIKNSANIVAVTVVLTLIGFALVTTRDYDPVSISPLSQSLKTFSVVYQTTSSHWSQWMKQLTQPLKIITTTETGKILLIGCIIFFFYVTLDQIFGRRFHTRK